LAAADFPIPCLITAGDFLMLNDMSSFRSEWLIFSCLVAPFDYVCVKLFLSNGRDVRLQEVVFLVRVMQLL
jgi:hypothetical protein